MTTEATTTQGITNDLNGEKLLEVISELRAIRSRLLSTTVMFNNAMPHVNGSLAMSEQESIVFQMMNSLCGTVEGVIALIKTL